MITIAFKTPDFTGINLEVKIGSKFNSYKRSTEMQEETDVGCIFNFNCFKFLSIPFIILHKFSASPTWYLKNKSR